MKLMLVDDEQLIREGLAYLLSNYDDIEIVAQAANGEEALALAGTYPIDIILMDIRMPIMDGCTATKLIKEAYPKIKILILTTFRDDVYIKEALASGASGYLLKDSSPQLIYTSLQNVCTGGFVLDESMAKEVIESKYLERGVPKIDLSERDLAIIALIVEGKNNKEIGENLHLTEGTIKNCITTLLAKLDLKDRTQIVTFAFRSGLIK